MSILALTPSPEALVPLRRELPDHDFIVEPHTHDALARVRDSDVTLILLDEAFAGGAALDLLPRLVTGGVPVVVLARAPSAHVILDAMERGAHDVLRFPPDASRVRALVDAYSVMADWNEPSASMAEAADDSMLCRGRGMVEVLKTVSQVAPTPATVLIRGESGTGKELIAQSIHERSKRSGLFVPINCAALPENLLESELFGHEKGAFTGAEMRKIGRFERAEGGTLFLDEIGDMPVALQAKILRALQAKEIERVGGNATIRVNTRVIAATHANLESLIVAGRFRSDLYYRLNVVTLIIPPLRVRGPETIRLLVTHFVNRAVRAYDRPTRSISPEVFPLLYRHPWPGNVRQLENAAERAVLACEGYTLLPRHLPPEVQDPA